MPLRLAVGGVSNDVSSIASSSALFTLAVLGAAAVLGARWLDRRGRFAARSTRLWFAGLASLALVVAVTLFRDGLPVAIRFGNLGDWSSDGLRRLSRDPLGSSQFVLNVVLFVPAGVAWTLISRRPVVSWLTLTGLSLLIESIQAITGAGANDVADLAANSLGAATGAAATVAVCAVLGERSVDPSSRSRRLLIAAVSVAALAVLAGWFIGASNRQQNVEDVLRARFAGTDCGDIETGDKGRYRVGGPMSATRLRDASSSARDRHSATRPNGTSVIRLVAQHAALPGFSTVAPMVSF